ncbi:MAG: hypothetical protein L6R30_19155 [Thermoanaerobaculia bacterium]|nr:hypothetical protein [Thermoanaerobaculia bacterium]
MSSSGAFQLAYKELETRMRELAEADGDIFLPNPPPEGPADFVLICMEPSLGRWADSPDVARTRVAEGFRNFLSSAEDFILHFCARNYLCRPGQQYFITDLSKGAMLVAAAQAERVSRYDRWYPLLLDELRLVARPGSTIVAVGSAVAGHLRRMGFSRPFKPVIHYSGQASRARKAGIRGREADFELFGKSDFHQALLATAERVLVQAEVPAVMRADTLSRLSKGQVTISRLQLMFCYKLAFESLH